MLNLLEPYDLKSLGPQSAEALHLMIEAKKLAYEDRARYYADPDFAKVPVAELISKPYAASRGKLIDRSVANPRPTAGDPKPADTIYMTVADKDGNAVSLIQSNFSGFGSEHVPGDLGFPLQNRGCLFALDPKHANRLEPRKRPFHTIIPGFVTRDGKPWLSFGLMGGDMQAQGHAQVLVNMIDFGMDVQAAGDAPRFYHSGLIEADRGHCEGRRIGRPRIRDRPRGPSGARSQGAPDRERPRQLRRLPGDPDRYRERRSHRRVGPSQGRRGDGILTFPTSGGLALGSAGTRLEGSPMRLTGQLAIITLILASLTPSSRGDLIGGGEQSPGQKLRAVFEAYWDDELRADPLSATANGDHRFDDRMPDPSESAHDAKVARDRATRAALEAIRPESLSPQDRLDREVLVVTLDDRLGRERFRAHLIPFTQQEGLPLQFAQSVNYHPASTVGDLENYLRRLRAFPAAIDATIRVMRAGMAEHRVPPRVSMAKTIPQLRALAPSKPEDSPLHEIVGRLPKDWPDSTKGPILTELRRAIAEHVSPSYARLADFIEREYLPACRESVGLWDSPGGPEHYASLARSFTTTDLSPDAIHALGLAEIARTREAMDAIRRQVGFEGDLPAFLAHVRADPKLRGGTEAALLARYRTILEEVDARLPLLFGKLPRTDYALKTMEPYRAKSAPAGFYVPPPEDGSRPGYFYVNTSDPDQRTTQSMPALAYHEAVPGHHLQFALGLEAPGRPAFRRFGYVPAFSEGWGLYAEGLTRESAWPPIPIPSWDGSNTTPGDPPGWLSTPGCTTFAGPGIGRSPISKPIPPCPGSRS